MSYRTSMPLILQYLGYKVTADFFDDIDDAEQEGPEREVVSKEEEIRRHAEREKRRVFGLAAWRKGKARATGQPDSAVSSAPASAPATPPQASTSKLPSANGHVGADEDDLPPREDTAVFDLAAIRAELQTTAEGETRASTDGLPPRLAVADVPPRPASAAPTPTTRAPDDVVQRRSPSPPAAPPEPEAWPDEPYRPPGSSTVSLSFANDDDELEPEPPRPALDTWSSARLPAFPSAWDDDPKW